MGVAGQRQVQQRTGWEITTLVAQLDRERHTAEHHSHLRVADGRLMWLLSDRQPRTLREVSEALKLEQSTVNRQVNAALKGGLLRRSREPGQPAGLVTVTDEGLARFEADLALHLGLFETALGTLGEAEQGQFLTLLRRFVDGYAEGVRDRFRSPD